MKKEAVVWQRDFSKVLGKIQGIVPYGTTQEELKHLVIDQKGKAIIQGVGEKKHKDLFTVDGGHVHCVARNPSNTNDIAIGSKD